MRNQTTALLIVIAFAFGANGQVTGSGTANKIPKWTGTTTLGDSVLAELNGKIGIGTTTPSSLLHIFSTATGDAFAGMGVDPAAISGSPAFNFGYSGASYGRGSGFLNVRPDPAAVAPNPSLRFSTENVQRMIITNLGRVGINNTNPAFLLDVNGDAHFASNVTVDGNLAAKYQDVAEWVPATGDLTPGTVVVLNPGGINEVMPSSRAYDTTVAGVVSAQPGLILGVPGAAKEQIATTGRVRVKVDATAAPIRVGDLLVTSDRAGTAMRSEPLAIRGREFHQPGTIVGKALEPLAGGTGEILVLLSLQ